MDDAPSPQTARLVLIVDDDRAVRESASRLLADEGFASAGFADGIEALEAVRAGLRPAVILLDITMPRMDGWDFRNAQRADPVLRDVPVVIVTATGFSEATIRLQFGEVPVLRKPLQPGELLETIARLVGRPEAPERPRDVPSPTPVG
ncbi:MAG TPA: response regulator [Polyangia bacterium]|nr:response regulator [Polyangia bacterium]